MTDGLGKFGSSFQIKVLTSLLTDKSFIQQTSDILTPKFFDTEAKQWLTEQIFSHFGKYKQAPTLDTFKIQIDKEELPDILQKTIIDDLRNVFQHTNATDLDYIKDETVNFCKNQCIKQAILESVQILQTGEDYETIKVKIDQAMKAGADKEIGHEYNEEANIDFRYTDAVRNVKPTPWDAINDIVEGGFGMGELVVFVAPAGIGKSWGLINVGAHAIKKGLTVAHYTLELNEAYVGLRYDAVVTGIANQNLKFNLDEVKHKVKNLPGELIVKYYPTKTASVNTIKSHLDKMILQDKKPDLVVVDYADLLRAVNVRGEVRHDLESIYEDLRGMAGEYELPVFTASQANRSALDDDVIGADKISESYAKIMIADFVISLSRKIEDKLSGTGRFHVIKNRFGPDGMTFPSKLNLSNGQIQIFEETSDQGRSTNKTMESGEEVTRKHLANKWKEINGNFG
jgi:replicative DNA helicase